MMQKTYHPDTLLLSEYQQNMRLNIYAKRNARVFSPIHNSEIHQCKVVGLESGRATGPKRE